MLLSLLLPLLLLLLQLAVGNIISSSSFTPSLISSSSSSSSTPHTWPGSISPAPVHLNCTVFQYALSRAGAELTECMGQAARPFTLCARCWASRDRFLALHRLLDAPGNGGGGAEDVRLDAAADGSSCGRYLMQLDSVQVLARTRDFVQSVWATGHCDDCFVGEHRELVGNDSRPAYRPEMVKFFDNSERLQQCFANYSRFPHLDNSSLPTNESRQVCDNCKALYYSLNNEFLALTNQNAARSERRMCMDVVDSMNSTQRLWSETFGCDNRLRSLQPLPLILAAYITAVLFYVGARGRGEIQQRKLLKQKRLSGFGSGSLTASSAANHSASLTSAATAAAATAATDI